MENPAHFCMEINTMLSLRELYAFIPHSDKAALDHLLDGLRKAGLPE